MDYMARFHWAVRCRAHSSRTGLPCRAWAIRGGYHCWSHSGATIQVRAAAQRRLLEAKTEAKLVRTFGRPLNTVERSWVTGDSTELRREIRDLVREIRADTVGQ